MKHHNNKENTLKQISYRDILTIPEFKGIREIDLLHPSMDEKVKQYLWEMGIDTRLPIGVTANLHRDLNNKVGVGYLYCGEMRRDREYINSPWCSLVERVSIAYSKDFSLGQELVQLMNRTFDAKALSETDEKEWEEEFQVDEDFEKNSQLIATLLAVRDSVRGSVAA